MTYCKFILIAVTALILNSSTAFAQRRLYAPKKLWAQGSFLVKPKPGSNSYVKKSSSIERKAMAKASQMYQARALSAQKISEDKGIYVFKVKMRKRGRIFSKLVKVK